MQRMYKNIVAKGSSKNHFGDVYVNRKSRKGLLLKSLAFEGMYHPRELEAFEGTYEWIFEDNATSFPGWARHGDGVFWITGKAGSGKSTLMRFLAGHQQTESLLQEWAGSDRVIIANHFFWSAGTRMQKSQLGLMQSLLYQLVCEADVVTIDAVAEHRETGDDSAWRRPWSGKELSKALSSLVRELPQKQRYCLFIDGLDEYELHDPDEGNYGDLVEYINTLAASPFAKVCVASRPWNVFKDAYAQLGPYQISMQDLTADDMAIFIKHHLSEDPLFTNMLAQNSDFTDLVETIQRSAEGVFLWVTLAVKQIRWGLREQDDLETLKRRIQQLPTELDAFLERIFQSIESVHEVFAAQVLLLTLQAIFPSGRELLEYSFIEDLVSDPGRAGTAPARPLSAVEIRTRTARTEMSINKWCKDLLQVNRTGPKRDAADRYGYDFPRVEITFPHRTIADFAHSKQEAGVLEKMAGKDFSALFLKWNMMLLVLKGSPDDESFKVAAHHTLELLEEGFESQRIDYVQQFDELDRLCACSFPASTNAHWSSALRYYNEPICPATPAGHSAASLALHRKLDRFAHHTLSQEANKYTSEQLHYALALALVGRTPSTSNGRYLNFTIVILLLQSRLTPRLNDLLVSWHARYYSIWQLFLLRMAGSLRAETKSGSEAHDIIGIVRLLLEQGADPDGRIYMADLAVDTTIKLQQPVDRGDFRHAKQIFGELQQWEARSEAGSGQIASRYQELKCLLESSSQTKLSGAPEARMLKDIKIRSRSRFRTALGLRAR